MYKSLLVPLDGSKFAEQAIPLALSIARKSKATLRLVQIHVPYVYVDSMVTLDAPLDRELRAREARYLESVGNRVRQESGLTVQTAIIDGAIADVLSSDARNAKVDLIVMTTHGRGPLSRFWLGSVADQLVRSAPVPVLLVRPQETPAGRAEPSVLEHLLIPLDGSPLAEQILEPARELACLTQAEITLLRVIRPLDAVDESPADKILAGMSEKMIRQLHELHEQVRREAEDYLKRLAEQLRSRGAKVRTSVVTEERVAETILSQARANSQDVIALSTHARHGLARLFLGSVADKVLRGAATPVLVFHSTAPTEGQRGKP